MAPNALNSSNFPVSPKAQIRRAAGFRMAKETQTFIGAAVLRVTVWLQSPVSRVVRYSSLWYTGVRLWENI